METTQAPFGDNDQAKTKWTDGDIWMRRTFTLIDINFNELYLKLHHDDNVHVYLNGEEIYTCNCWNGKMENFLMNDSAKSKLKKGTNILAVHCSNTAGGTWLDVGLADKPVSKSDAAIKVAIQKSVNVTATQSKYTFNCGSVGVTLTFVNPLLIQDSDQLSKPVSYISFKLQSNDGKAHSVAVYFGASSDIAVNIHEQTVTACTYTSGLLNILKAGIIEQPVLKKRGDDLRID